MNEEEEKKKREIVTPGEVIATGPSYLPGEGSVREAENILATRYGLAEREARLVKVIPIAGVYWPRRGNIVIGKIVDITFNGWVVDIAAPHMAFLPVAAAPRFIRKDEDLSTIYDFEDMIVTKVTAVKPRGIDITMKERGLHRLTEGMIISINSNKVPRVIGKQGSMVNTIKELTGCNIIVGQNGIVWIKGEHIEDELLAKEAINLVAEKALLEGLTEQVKAFLEKEKARKK